MKRSIVILFALFLTLSINAQSFKIVVNSSNSVNSLTKKELSDFFLKKRTKWSSGIKVIPVDLSSKSSVRTAFTKEIHEKTVSQIRAYWQQSVFAGKQTPPREMNSDQKIIEFVKMHKGAIGYVSKQSNTEGLKTITIK